MDEKNPSSFGQFVVWGSCFFVFLRHSFLMLNIQGNFVCLFCFLGMVFEKKCIFLGIHGICEMFPTFARAIRYPPLEATFRRKKWRRRRPR